MAESKAESEARKQRLATARAVQAKAEADARAAQVRAESEARVAEANARAAEAKATAEAKAVEAKAHADEAARADEAAKRKAAADREPRERAYQIGINVAAPVVGIAAGHAIAGAIKSKADAAVKAAAPELKKLATKAAPLVGKAASGTKAAVLSRDKLAAIVSTADKLKIGKAGPLGIVTAGILLAEGAVSRFVLPDKVPDETGKEALRAVGSASLFAATNIVGERLMQNATRTVMPDAGHLATVDAARNVVARAAAPAAGGGIKAAVSAVAKIASRAGPVALFAGLAATAAASLLPSGTEARPATPPPGAAPGADAGSNATAIARSAAQRTATDMSTPGQTVGATSASSAAQPMPPSDGQVDAYTRKQNGHSVFVHGYHR